MVESLLDPKYMGGLNGSKGYRFERRHLETMISDSFGELRDQIAKARHKQNNANDQ